MDSLICVHSPTQEGISGGRKKNKIKTPNLIDRIKRQPCVYVYTYLQEWVN